MKQLFRTLGMAATALLLSGSLRAAHPGVDRVLGPAGNGLGNRRLQKEFAGKVFGF